MVIYTNPNEIDWGKVELMHEDAKKWIDEIKFIADEHSFLDELLSGYFLKLSSEENFPKATALVKKLTKNEKTNQVILDKVQAHNNQLDVLIDNKQQPFEEREVKADHNVLKDEMSKHLKAFREIKNHIFDVIIDIMKKDKQKRLLL
ncbi:hypothetical protein [Abyssalbus ytuae]|uniref:Uncharacterized protein n=1 Tax=Abyssalbus ytuae TaxID=2926907 RepID=A0A9E7A007_9FLAO|nr:hypothetical protein [Abyssalbus ytuae]UOB17091.1 hypothetical protein MQE35_15290 [Abyssalbus ytuae]